MKIYRVLLIGFIFFFGVQTTWAQSGKREQRKIERAEKKRLKEEERRKSQELLMDLVKDQSFVLEASTLTGRYNQRMVNPSTNFVKVEGNQVLVQTAFNAGMGYNGLGGVTVRGTIKDYQVTERKGGVTVFIQFSDPVLGLSSLNLNLQSNGNATALVSNWGNRATFQGQVVPAELARVYRGLPLI